ncbi:hypothetical protein [Deinococcus multiflagellatus]|uniref:Uncharacterized protein n=1 Tax=Deinococcus multiflagellatus TaxID=1656887 RepID=A0ABW1ZIG0_9DEIO
MQLGFPAELTLLAGLLCLVAAARLLWGRVQRQGRPHPADWLMTAGLLVLGAAWLVAGALLYWGGAGGPAALPDQAAAEGLGRRAAEAGPPGAAPRCWAPCCRCCLG